MLNLLKSHGPVALGAGTLAFCFPLFHWWPFAWFALVPLLVRAGAGSPRAAFPEAKIINFPVKPSVARWKLYDVQQEVNAAVKEMLAADKNAIYVDYVARMLGPDGKPDPGLLKKDGLHMNEKGYAIWNELLRPHLAP